MKHCVFLFLGEDFQDSAALVARHILKADNEVIRQHFSALILTHSETNDTFEVRSVVQKEINETLFHPDEDYRYQVGFSVLNPVKFTPEALKAFFSRWYETHVLASTEGAGDHMQLVFIAKASDQQDVDRAITIASHLDGSRFRFDIDFLLIAPDAYSAFIADEKRTQDIAHRIDGLHADAKKVVMALLKARTTISPIQQIILLQNLMKNGASLNLDHPTFARIIGEYAMACIENYLHLYNPVLALSAQSEDKIVGLGLSCLCFDRNYYLNFLLHHAYLQIMKREGVKQKVADVNKVAHLATETLQGRTDVLTNFYNKYVQAEIDKGKTGDEVVNSGLMKQMEEFISDLEKTITNHINDEELSLPEKSALIAQILLKDEDMLSGYLYNKGQPAFIDLFREPVNFFLDNYNASLEFEKDENGEVVKNADTGIPIIKEGVLTEPQNQEGYIYAPIDELKKLRMDIQQCSEFIRQRTEELEQLEKNQKAAIKVDDVVIEDDNYFRKFKLIGDDIHEDPLKENYEPKETTDTNIDLSHEFTSIKNQGPVGACTTFALTSVYEYILKKNDLKEHDLSERFLYYNAREADNRLDKEGVAISTAIRSVSDRGICLEEKWPYSQTEYNVKPSGEAYEDALNRKIKKALNVVIGNDKAKNRDAIRSAVAEGYPVVISFNLYEGFYSIGKDGIVPLPTAEEVKEMSKGPKNSHAMALCGYDDKNQVFLVRNSWGERFGKNGYCFIPYDTMSDHIFLNSAYIITEVSDDSIKVRGMKGRHKVVLDLNDIGVKIAMTRNAIAAKKKEQEALVATYNHVYTQYEQLIEALRNPTIRDDMMEQSGTYYTTRMKEATVQLREQENDKLEQLEQYDNQTFRNKLKGCGIVAALVIIYAIITFVFGYQKVLTYIIAPLVAIGTVIMLRYASYRKDKRHTLEAELNEVISKQQHIVAEFDMKEKLLSHKQHVAGMVLDSLAMLSTNLQSLQYSLYNYVKNLSVWYDEENQKVSQMQPEERIPFMTILDNNVLNSYFEKNADSLTSGIRLYAIWNGNYQIDDKAVFTFKNQLKQLIRDELAKSLEGFSIYEYIAGIRAYDFLTSHATKDLRPKYITDLNRHSEMLTVPINENTEMPSHFIYVMCNEKLAYDWYQLCSQHTEGGTPQCGTIVSPYKVLEIQLEYNTLDNIALFA